MKILWVGVQVANSQSLPTDVELNQQPATGSQSLWFSFVTTSETVDRRSKDQLDRQLLHTAAKSLGIDVSPGNSTALTGQGSTSVSAGAQTDSQESAAGNREQFDASSYYQESKHSDKPMNDYDLQECLFGFVAAFPTIFLLGQACDNPPNKLNPAELQHLLLQYNNCVAWDRRLRHLRPGQENGKSTFLCERQEKCN